MLSGLYLLKHVGERSESIGLEGTRDVPGQIRLVSRCVDQFEHQVGKGSAFNTENSFARGMNTLRHLVGEASEAAITRHALLSRRLAVVAYRCGEVAATGRVVLVLNVPSPPNRAEVSGRRRSLTFFVATVVVAFGGWLIF